MKKTRPLFFHFFLILCVLCTKNLASSHFKIYDCFIFFNELELLEIRLNELYDVVDHFVIVESTHTFRGNPKPLYFKENSDHFSQFADKIIYVCVGKTDSDNPWKQEAFQRNSISRGLINCSKKDVILISDVDEIPSRESIPRIVHALKSKEKKVVSCEQTLYRYYLNLFDHYYPWVGTVATTYAHFKRSSPEELRVNRWKTHLPAPVYMYPVIPRAGWHFTFLGGPNRVTLKLESYAHSENDLPENKTNDAIRKYIETYCEEVRIDHSYPKFVQDHLEELYRAGLIYSADLLED